MSNVYDYIYRPITYERMTLYDWIRKAKKEKCSKEDQEEFDAHYDKDENEVDPDDESVTEGEDEINFLGGGMAISDIKDESANYQITLNIVHTRWLLLMMRMLFSQILLVEAYLAVIKVTGNIIVLPCFLFSNLGEMVKI